MEKDIRESATYREIETLCKQLRQPGTGQLSDATEIHVSSDGRHVVFSGTQVTELEGAPPTRICLTDLVTGQTQILTFGPNVDRWPRFSPDGRYIAFLSDRHKAGDFQLYLLDPISGAARPTALVDGWVEYAHWSPDARRILLGVAGHGADVAGGQGAVTSNQLGKDAPSWAPAIEIGDESYRWRTAWVFDIDTGRVRRVSPDGSNIWEAVWCGSHALAAVVSSGPGEGLWYSARAHIVEVDTGSSRELYAPNDQLGCPAASPSGQRLAIVEAVCSDRWIVAGDLKLIDTNSGEAQRVNTLGVDVSFAEWRSEDKLLLAGHRSFETVVGLYDVTLGSFTELWASEDISTGGLYVKVSGFNEVGDCVLVGEGFMRPPEIAVIQEKTYRTVKSLDLGYLDHAKAIGAVEKIIWVAPDGLQIQGWLLRPNGQGPYPTVMNVHGGPVWHWRPMWLGRAGALLLSLIKRGYAVFLPNPRGSTARGQDFVRHVVGDMGGSDTYDFLSGLDHLVDTGVADRDRIGVIGGSYGGFMASWLITQDARFAAAVPLAPITNQVSGHLIGNIPHFVTLFLAEPFNIPGGKYFRRSPIMYADRVKTPTLNICGALDRCTPPEEAVQFHRALLENGVKSVLVTYPEEGHGIRKFPAAMDYAARAVMWFESHMPASTRKK